MLSLSIFRLAIVLLCAGPTISWAAGEVFSNRPATAIGDSADGNANAIWKASQFCGVKVENEFLPETKRGHTLCGAAVTQMVKCMSKMLGLGTNCDAHCGNGRDFTAPGCVRKMESCGYVKREGRSPECMGPGAVTSYRHTPTKRGQIYGHVQFGCGNKFCSSYRTPLSHPWPNPFVDACFVPKIAGTLSPDWKDYQSGLEPKTLPRFNFEGHKPPVSEKCAGCAQLAQLLAHYQDQVDHGATPDERLKTAREISDTMRKSSITYRDLANEVRKLQIQSAMISALAIENDDFDSDAYYHLLSYCSLDRENFQSAFWNFPVEDQRSMSLHMLVYQLKDGLGKNCVIPPVKHPGT